MSAFRQTSDVRNCALLHPDQAFTASLNARSLADIGTARRFVNGKMTSDFSDRAPAVRNRPHPSSSLDS